MVGIVGYGAYLPHYRIKAEVIATQWGADPASVTRGLQLFEKTVPGQDEDTITIAVEAAKNALRRGNRPQGDRSCLHRFRITSVYRQTKWDDSGRCSWHWSSRPRREL